MGAFNTSSCNYKWINFPPCGLRFLCEGVVCVLGTCFILEFHVQELCMLSI
jgi:hypothetical protein